MTKKRGHPNDTGTASDTGKTRIAAKAPWCALASGARRFSRVGSPPRPWAGRASVRTRMEGTKQRDLVIDMFSWPGSSWKTTFTPRFSEGERPIGIPRRLASTPLGGCKEATPISGVTASLSVSPPRGSPHTVETKNPRRCQNFAHFCLVAVFYITADAVDTRNGNFMRKDRACAGIILCRRC